MNGKFLEHFNIQQAFLPVDLQTAANEGDFVNLKEYGRVIAVIFKGVGTAGDDPVITLEQAQAAAGTGVKGLNFTEIWEKIGANAANFTRITQDAASTYENEASAEAVAIWAIEVTDEMLDVANGFTHIRVTVADVGGNAQLGCGLYIMGDPRFAGDLADPTA